MGYELLTGAIFLGVAFLSLLRAKAAEGFWMKAFYALPAVGGVLSILAYKLL